MEEKKSSYVIGIPASFPTVRGHNVAVQVQAPAADSAAGRAPAARAMTSAEKCKFSDFSISGSEITANWDAEFLIRNNRGPTLYQYLLLSVYYKDQPISKAVLGQQFHLLPKSMGSNYVAHTVALSKRIENQVVADAIARDYWSQGAVAFTVRLLHDNDRPVRFLNVTCADVKSNNTGQKEDDEPAAASANGVRDGYPNPKQYQRRKFVT
ncbi:late embryogenesis abundant hydroxyproline-rich glycoprotein [Corchorus capsularis]|uniref:Late embryogenesis abundant hydroxyproline-rich glycoprotein n=1 Tax=Corchorus capsularis TaxID=210143 RepID=A0A1R3HPU5_COCAP|nr:late embryogenesis abundant hydroxyproline-rich glycoprotein [Corchorus capsularis]